MSKKNHTEGIDHRSLVWRLTDPFFGTCVLEVFTRQAGFDRMWTEHLHQSEI